MKLGQTQAFAESTEKEGNLTVSQEQIDEALELICSDPAVVDLTQKPLDLAITVASKAKQWVLANTAESSRDDVENQFTEERILAMRNQALSLLFDKYPPPTAPTTDQKQPGSRTSVQSRADSELL